MLLIFEDMLRHVAKQKSEEKITKTRNASVIETRVLNNAAYISGAKICKDVTDEKMNYISSKRSCINSTYMCLGLENTFYFSLLFLTIFKILWYFKPIQFKLF